MENTNTPKKATFVVQVLNNQHNTLQGVVNWTGGRKSEHFRSALELLHLIDSATGADAAPAQKSDDD